MNRSDIFFTIFIYCLFLSISIGYPQLYITDEWISTNQLEHLINEKDLLHGYTPYGATDYSENRDNILMYSLALPVFSYPIYHLFSLFGDSFRLFIAGLWLILGLFSVLLIEFKYPQFSRYKGIPWTYGALFALFVMGIFNFWLYQDFIFLKRWY